VARIGEMGDLCKCSFCGSSQRQVNKLIAGPGVWICDGCVDTWRDLGSRGIASSTQIQGQL